MQLHPAAFHISLNSRGFKTSMPLSNTMPLHGQSSSSASPPLSTTPAPPYCRPPANRRSSCRLGLLQRVDQPVEVRAQLPGRREAHVARHAHPVAQVLGGRHHGRRSVRRCAGGHLRGAAHAGQGRLAGWEGQHIAGGAASATEGLPQAGHSSAAQGEGPAAPGRGALTCSACGPTCLASTPTSSACTTCRSAASAAGMWSSAGTAVGSASGALTGLGPRLPAPLSANLTTAWLFLISLDAASRVSMAGSSPGVAGGVKGGRGRQGGAVRCVQGCVAGLRRWAPGRWLAAAARPGGAAAAAALAAPAAGATTLMVWPAATTPAQAPSLGHSQQPGGPPRE
jgi:hypothetical protein